jgi:serine-type D-Ala-D-Ala carboxypeptidase/endopeptidase (penicillin-binding protein 4)
MNSPATVMIKTITQWCCRWVPCLGCLLVLASCSVSKRIDAIAGKTITHKKELESAHIGITVYNPATGKYLYNSNGNKYFIPASNTKIITCYAAMKYLDDSLPGLSVAEFNNFIVVSPTGDPTLLHPDFANQPVIDFLVKQPKGIFFSNNKWRENVYGAGWSWDDYDAYYMAERSPMPIYGNVLSVKGKAATLQVVPNNLATAIHNKNSDTATFASSISRDFYNNQFAVQYKSATQQIVQAPFITSDSLALRLLQDTIHKTFSRQGKFGASNSNTKANSYTVYSQPTDTMLKIMMHRSDNFYAEQSLLMLSNQRLGIMSDAAIIDTLLKSDFKAMPQKPRWVDGSGLSRYNLFTPQDFVFVLDKMKQEFNWQRITTIFATGGGGTLNGQYDSLQGKLYAKTGTLSNNIALSGYLITNKGQTLIFSIMVGNHTSSSALIRNSMEAFLTKLVQQY